MPITTPSASTLSTPSPTERNSPPPPLLAMPTATPMSTTRPIYIIVATAMAPRMGIGLNGQLPWPSLKSDMAFFRRVTSSTGGVGVSVGGGAGGNARNAVVMGRKTWESIPPRFRPLSGRVNVVITRSGEIGGISSLKDVLVAKSFEDSLSLLKAVEGLGKVFVIGGAQIYGSAIEMISASSSSTKEKAEEKDGKEEEETGLRILQTQVRRNGGGEIECDTFFPLDLGDVEGKGWKRASPDQLRDWVDGNEKVPGGDGDWKVDGGGEMEIRVVGWEKV